ncbi:MAG: DUF7689 domain-containing protein [Isosphaeraceae bacterium]
MATGGRRDLTEWFPKLAETPHRITSAYDPRYNCIAWAAGDRRRWWEPDEDGDRYWPPDAPREYSPESYIRAFESIGFERCESTHSEPGYEKVAVFANEGGPTHAARQLSGGTWSSKLGVFEDIEHQLEALAGNEGEEYGSVVQILRRRIPVSRSS